MRRLRPNVVVALLISVVVTALAGAVLPAWGATPLLAVTSRPATFSPNGDGFEDTLVLAVRLTEVATLSSVVVDGEGALVRKLAAGQSGIVGDNRLSWDGRRDDGSIAPDGRYTVRIAATAVSGLAEETSFPTAVDSRVPVRLTAPAAGAAVGSPYELTFVTIREVSSVVARLPGCGALSATEPTSADESSRTWVLRGELSASCAVGSQSLAWVATWTDLFGTEHTSRGSRDVEVPDLFAPALTLIAGETVRVIARESEKATSSAVFSVACQEQTLLSLAINVQDESGQKLWSAPPKDSILCGGLKKRVAYETWDGKDSDGRLVADGSYTVQITGIDSGGRSTTVSEAVVVDTAVPAELSEPKPGATLTNHTDIVVQPLAGKTLTGATASLGDCATWSLGARGDGSFALAGADVSSCRAGEQPFGFGATWADQFGGSHLYRGGSTVSVVDDAAPVLAENTYRSTGIVARASRTEIDAATIAWTCADGSPVDYTTEIQSLTGERVVTLSAGQKLDCTSGGSIIDSWDGRDTQGVLVPDGDYRAVIKATDSGGRPSAAQADVLVDTRAAAAVVSPVAEATVNGTVDLQVVPTSGFAVTLVSASVQSCSQANGQTSTVGADGRFHVQLDVAGCSSGPTAIYWNAVWTDKLGRAHYYTDSQPVSVQNSAPDLAVTVHQNILNTAVTRRTPSEVTGVSWGISCLSSGAVSFGLQVVNADGVVVRQWPTYQWSDCAGLDQSYARYFYWDGTDDQGQLVPDGDYRAVAMITDANRASAKAEAAVLVDTRAPGGLTTPVAGQTIGGFQRFAFAPTDGFADRLDSISVVLQSGQESLRIPLSASGAGLWETTYSLAEVPTGTTELSWTAAWHDAAGGSHDYTADAVTVTVGTATTTPEPTDDNEGTGSGTTTPTVDPTTPTADPTTPSADPTTPTADPTTPTADPTTPTADPTTPTADPTTPTADPTTPTSDPSGSEEPTPDQPPAPTSVKISGTPRTDAVLSAVLSGPTTGWQLAYRWQRDAATVVGVSSASYRLRATDVGHRVSVIVTARRADATPVELTAPAVLVRPGVLTPRTPTVLGTSRVGNVLFAVPGTWQPSPVQLSFQWFRNGVAIRQATDRAYRVVAADRGAKLSVAVTGRKAGYSTLTRTSTSCPAVK